MSTRKKEKKTTFDISAQTALRSLNKVRGRIEKLEKQKAERIKKFDDEIDLLEQEQTDLLTGIRGLEALAGRSYLTDEAPHIINRDGRTIDINDLQLTDAVEFIMRTTAPVGPAQVLEMLRDRRFKFTQGQPAQAVNNALKGLEFRNVLKVYGRGSHSPRYEHKNRQVSVSSENENTGSPRLSQSV